jgi:hypothetical protein
MPNVPAPQKNTLYILYASAAQMCESNLEAELAIENFLNCLKKIKRNHFNSPIGMELLRDGGALSSYPLIHWIKWPCLQSEA